MLYAGDAGSLENHLKPSRASRRCDKLTPRMVEETCSSSLWMSYTLRGHAPTLLRQSPDELNSSVLPLITARTHFELWCIRKQTPLLKNKRSRATRGLAQSRPRTSHDASHDAPHPPKGQTPLPEEARTHQGARQAFNSAGNQILTKLFSSPGLEEILKLLLSPQGPALRCHASRGGNTYSTSLY